MKRSRDDMEIVWQTPANPPERHDYIFRDGRRHVRPYYFEFISHVKNRWAGKTIVDLFAEEFKGRPYDYYVSAVKRGRIQVDGQVVPVSYIVQSSQKISHFLHRHEPPVMALDVSILVKEPDVVTVCKPASVPIEAGMVRKQYIAKVVGVFPNEEKVVNANITYNAREGRSTVEVGNSCDDTPLKSKHACTKFTMIKTDGTHSIVLCEPLTGRTHQIRVHLQYTGHPIGNDELYLSRVVAARSTKGMGADKAAMVNSACPTSDLPLDNHSNDTEESSSGDFDMDPMCTNCPNLAPKGYDGHEEGLWLHCVKYSGPNWAYECPYPEWAIL